jgi:hypothetical protein
MDQRGKTPDRQKKKKKKKIPPGAWMFALFVVQGLVWIISDMKKD